MQLLTSKSRVVDLQSVTIPRMELTAARLGAKLAIQVAGTLGLDGSQLYFWTDSTIVLHWLRKIPSDLKVFVGNRVSEIQNITKRRNWRHVESKKNPADLISRAETVERLKNSRLWWDGPSFLLLPSERWPKIEAVGLTSDEQGTADGEKRTKINWVALNTQKGSGSERIPLTEKYKFTKTLRITAYVMRFVEQCKAGVVKNRMKDAPMKLKVGRTKSSMKTSIAEAISEMKPLCVKEIKAALGYWIRHTQKRWFSRELKCLQSGKALDNSSNIRGLVPFIEEGTQILRVRGRLQNATLTYDQQYPILLPNASHLTKSLIEEAHKQTMHGGTQVCMQYLRDKYWIILMRNAVKAHIRKCIKCAIQYKKTMTQRMADLPSARVKAARPFANCGVDYAGPFKLKSFTGRGAKVRGTAYVVVFVCMVSKAVHLELASELTSQAFLAALDRMILRRNHVENLYSDNGRNFVGAANELDKVYRAWQTKDVIDDLAVKGITWHFNTPLAPHHGGLWEAAVKSFKHHLYTTVGNGAFTFEELYTILVRIEAILNSRPLTTPQ